MQVTYVTSALRPEQLPVNDRAEIAFIGRSNTGKSTLLNALAGVKGLARTSRTPGRTQMINFFSYGKNFSLVDLPGYGFSKTPMMVAKNWEQLIEDYLKRQNISDFLFLMDCRRTIDEMDIKLLKKISQSVQPLVVITKIDKINRRQTESAVRMLKEKLEELKVPFRDIVATSGPKKQGINQLRQSLFELA